jgi:hypothetical protein
MKTKIEILILAITVLSFYGCKRNSTEPLPVTNTTYTPLNTGDVRQLVYLTDSSTTLMKIVGTLKRRDGAEVFAMEWTYGTQRPDTQYYLIKDGFFMSTELSSGSSSINPFGEQRLGKVNPVNGETWLHTLGSSDSLFFTATYCKELRTLCGTFTNVYGFTMTEVSAGHIDTMMTPFYAENIGYIGTGSISNLRLDFSASYIKVANQEYGSLWPAKTVGLYKRNINNKLSIQAIAAYSLLGVKTPVNQAPSFKK